MRSFVLGVALLGVLGVQNSFGADLPRKAPVAVAPAPVMTWTGWYVGANAGGSWTDADLNYRSPFTGPGFISGTCGPPAGATSATAICNDNTSAVLGGQIGFNWQVNSFVFGIEADGNWRHIGRNQFTEFGDNPTAGLPMGSVLNDTARYSNQQLEFATVRGRLGWAQGQFLYYGTGGWAVGRVKHSFTEILDPGVGACLSAATCRTISDSNTASGWTAGAGVEMMLSNNWSAAVEYLYVDLGSTTLTLTPTGGFFSNTATVTYEDKSHVARIKLNYRWSALGLQ
ncbi:MAG: outer membrane beta-barrel protein [Tardiphaga sp.]|jgi:outer membrane immunogenic protein